MVLKVLGRPVTFDLCPWTLTLGIRFLLGHTWGTAQAPKGSPQVTICRIIINLMTIVPLGLIKVTAILEVNLVPSAN